MERLKTLIAYVIIVFIYTQLDYQGLLIRN
jgi:hypothetical protein